MPIKQKQPLQTSKQPQHPQQMSFTRPHKHDHIRHTETVTITQNLSYARTSPEATLASMDATAYIATNLSFSLVSHHSQTLRSRIFSMNWMRYDGLFPIHPRSPSHIQGPETFHTAVTAINSTFTVKDTTFSGTAMLDSGCFTCIVPISQLLK